VAPAQPGLFQESELPIPEQADAREDRREQYGHPDDAGATNCSSSPPGLLIDGPEAEAEDEQYINGCPSEAMTCARDRE
jgi:hypothetical protein